MDPISAQSVLATAGAADEAGTYVDDVFSTYLFNGTGSAQTITNGIDLSGEGGLVWIKRRSAADPHQLYDTERGANKLLRTTTTSDQVTSQSDLLTSFNSNGFSLGADSGGFGTNPSSSTMASWSFRKAPGFFDIVTYTGDSDISRTVSHSLGSVPGMIVVKKTSGSGGWYTWHRSLGGTGKALEINSTASTDTNSNLFSTLPTATVFSPGDNSHTNQSGQSYVAYLFAHDDQSFGTDSDEAIVKCGSYTGNGGYLTIDIGFEAQWVLIKRSSASGDWGIFDIMRGAPGGDDIQANGSVRLRPNTTQSEGGSGVGIHNNGFLLGDGSGEINTSGVTYIYMAIRRPNKPPSAGTDVFAIDTSDATSPSPPQFTSGFVTDFIIRKTMNGANATIGSRLQNTYYMSPYQTTKEDRTSPATALKWDFMDGWSNSSGVNTNLFCYMFKRAPGFLDVVAYQGTGSARTLNHNLEAVPELVIVKNRENSSYSWAVYTQTLGRNKVIALNSDEAASTFNAPSFWGSTDFTATQISLGSYANTNHNNIDMIAYLFASLSGISKIGTYSGTGYNIDVDCGFAAGARFVLIKRTDGSNGQSVGDWYVWDTTNGIVSGNDPYWRMNDASAEVTNTDYIDPLNAGFTVTSSAPAALNASGGTYIFLAIA